MAQKVARIVLLNMGQSAVQPLTSAMVSSEDFRIRESAAWSLLELVRSHPDLDISSSESDIIRAAMSDRRASVRSQCIILLSEIRPRIEAIAQAIKAAAEDKSKQVRDAAQHDGDSALVSG